MKWTDVAAGKMTPDEIGKEIKRYLLSYKKPSKLKITIEKEGDYYFTKVYMTVEEFKKES